MSNPLGVSRDQLAKFLPNHEVIRAFEKVLDQVGLTMPSLIEEANNAANTGLTNAYLALSQLSEVTAQLMQLLLAPSRQEAPPVDDYSPSARDFIEANFLLPASVLSFLPDDMTPSLVEPDYAQDLAPLVYVGTLGVQASDDVSITGGAIDGTTIGATTAATVRGTTLESTVSTGTAPLIIASTTVVPNLNVSQLLGKTWAIPDSIGATTPNAGSFTTLSATGDVNLRNGTGQVLFPNTGALYFNNAAGTGRQALQWYSDDNLYYTNQDGDHIFRNGAGAATTAKITSTGINNAAVGETTPSTGKFTTLKLTAAAPTAAAGQVGLGATTATTVGAAGGASALPATPLGYMIANVAGTAVKIPYYST